MKSTWRSWDRTQWTAAHWLIETLNIHHIDLDKEVPVHQKTDKVPYAPELQFHRWVLIHASIPLIIHQLYINYIGQPSALLVFIFYSLSLELIALHEVHVLSRR